MAETLIGTGFYHFLVNNCSFLSVPIIDSQTAKSDPTPCTIPTSFRCLPYRYLAYYPTLLSTQYPYFQPSLDCCLLSRLSECLCEVIRGDSRPPFKRSQSFLSVTLSPRVLARIESWVRNGVGFEPTSPPNWGTLSLGGIHSHLRQPCSQGRTRTCINAESYSTASPLHHLTM